MATSSSKNKSIDGCAQREYWINIKQLTFYPNGYGQPTKAGLLWRACSDDTFFRLDGRVPPGLEASCLLFVCLDHPRAVVACLPSDMKRLTTAQKDLLWPVGYHSRLGLMERVLQFGMNCKVGDCVLAVNPSGRMLFEPTKFVVRFKGPLREVEDRGSEYAGTYFGLVSTEPIRSSSNHTISCFSDVRSPDVVQYARRERTEADHQAVLCHLEWIVALVDKKFALKAGDKVLWFVDDRPSPLRGVVVRILNDKSAMVDFDIDGKKNQMDVLIESLMLASDFDIDTTERPASPSFLDSQPNPIAASAAAAAAGHADPDASAASGQHRRHPSDYDNAPPQQQPIDQIALAAEHGLELNAAVLVKEPRQHPPQQGFLRWVGLYRNRPIAGVDCEMLPLDAHSASSVRRTCPDAPNDAGVGFVDIDRVEIDLRFRESRPAAFDQSLTASQRFGHESCEVVEGDCPPLRQEDWRELCGQSKGIQGHHNSCYLDATLFAMFTSVSVFDKVLLRKRNKKDIPEYEEIKKCLKFNIVNCLRQHQFVRADHVLKLREQLDKLGKVPGMLNDEKDPEEFINLLLDHALKHEPYIKLSSNLGCHVLQLFVDATQYDLKLPDTETLLHLTLLQAGLKLTQVPPCLVLQTPRSGKDYKLFDRVLPSTELDISNLLIDHPRQCAVCGKLAEVECQDCFLNFDSGSKDYSFCKKCFKTSKEHKSNPKRHKSVEIKYPKALLRKYSDVTVNCPVKLKLFAVVCIHTSHYVCFLRLFQPNKQLRKWLFFDSMADRSGLESGYNIPEVTDAGDIDAWLDAAKLKDLSDKAGPNQQQPPPNVKRLLSDCYLCFYRSEDAEMYR